MADILLTHCNHLYFDPKQVRKMQPYPPLQTLLAAACLRREGYDVAFFDSTFDPPEEGFREALDQHRPRLVALCEDNFNFLTKMCLTRNRELAFSMIDAAKQRGLRVIVNGSDSTDAGETYLDAGADFVMVGELEQTLIDTARHLLGSRAPNNSHANGNATGASAIAGLVFRNAGAQAIERTPRRGLMTDLDALPQPAWDLIDVAAYRNQWCQTHGYFSLNMVSSRGCPYRCNWCAKPIYGETYQHRAPRAVAEEMRHLKDTIEPDQIWFADDIFALSGEWTRAFADAVEQLDARIPFKMQSRCDLMTRDTVEALRRAGCCEVWMGAESGSQKILDSMDKGVAVDQVGRARENLRLHGIRACYFLQFGYPGETWADIERTVRMVRETDPDDVGVSVSYPLPGTVFHDRVAAQLGSKRNWSDSDELAMMFQGTYTTEFYRTLRDAMHLEVEVRNRRRSNDDGSNGDGPNSDSQRVAELWTQVETMEKTCANPRPTPLWTSC